MASFDFNPPRKDPISAFSLAGLTDIVLLLLIFFLLTSNFIPQYNIQVALPEANSAAPTEPQYVTVSITRDGLFYVNADVVSGDSLLQAVQAVREGKDALVIRADRDATIGRFTQAASVAQAVGLRVLMATQREAR